MRSTRLDNPVFIRYEPKCEIIVADRYLWPMSQITPATVERLAKREASIHTAKS